MKNYFFSLLTSMILAMLCNQYVLADLRDQCLLGVPIYNKPLIINDDNQLSIYIQADTVEAHYPNNIEFFGNVNFKQDNTILSADQVYLHQQSQNKKEEPIYTVIASGNINYSSNEIRLKGQKLWSDINSKDIDVFQTHYQMVGRQGRGIANTLKQRNTNRYTVLKHGSFTSCLLGNDSWKIVGSKVIHDRQEQILEIWNARFIVGQVPIFYSPYLQLPVGDKRHSGFLYPNIKYNSSSGFELSIPFYLNLASNYDITIIPIYINKYGTQINIEFRYLIFLGEGMLNFHWLPNNYLYGRNYNNYNDFEHWFLYWRHDGFLDKVWHFNIDYTTANNSNYINHLNSRYDNFKVDYSTQKFVFSYDNRSWDIICAYKNFHSFDTSIMNSYIVMPQLDIIYYKNDFNFFDFKIFSQVIKFVNVNNDSPGGIRLHIEPIVNLPLTNQWGSLNTEVKLMATHYRQRNTNTYSKTTRSNQYYFKKNINRVIPQFKTEVQIILERDMNFFDGYIQTLEPRLQYLYVPYHKQNNIGVDDSANLQIGYDDLFYDRIYSGLSRIAPVNQLVGGVTTYIYDNQGMKRFNLSLSQIYNLSCPRGRGITLTENNYDTCSNVIWASNNYWRISNQWGIRGGAQYDSWCNNLALGDAILEYRHDDDHVFQLNYHYISAQYIKQILPEIANSYYQRGISQVGIIGSWPVYGRHSLVGMYYYDTKVHQLADQLVGIQYNTCCWAVNIGYERKIIGVNSFDSSSKYDNRVLFNVELRGLSSDYTLGAVKMLNSSILPYHQVF